MWSRLQSTWQRVLSSRSLWFSRRNPARGSAETLSRARHVLLGSPQGDAAKTVVILGAPRGGTSMVAGVVRELGVDLGRRLGVNHEDPDFLPKDLDLIRQRIKERNEAREVWGWKMPHSTDYIDQIEGDLRNPHVIFVFRNLLGTALSQERHSAADIHVGLNFSLKRLEAMITQINRLSCPMLLVDYDSAVAAKDEFLTVLTDFLQIKPDATAKARAKSFIDPEEGYRQIAANYYRVGKAEPGSGGGEIPTRTVWRHLTESEDGNSLVRNGVNPGLIVAPSAADHFPERLIVSIRNITPERRKTRFVFDYDGQFSRLMSQAVSAAPGNNCFLVETSGKARRICIVPEMVDDRSAVVLIGLKAAS